MNRVMMFVFAVLTCALVCVPASADDPPQKLTAEERKELNGKLEEGMTVGRKAYQAGKVLVLLR